MSILGKAGPQTDNLLLQVKQKAVLEKSGSEKGLGLLFNEPMPASTVG
jgi:hypothetical protein